VSIIRLAPFSAFTSLQREMQEMLERLDPRPVFPDLSFRPATDIFREDGTLVIKVEVPGIDPKDGLEIDVEGNVLHIEGEKKFEKEIKEEDHYLHERHVGSFSRDVVLPEGVDIEKITADYEEGVLTVRVPLPEEVLDIPAKHPIEVSIAEKV